MKNSNFMKNFVIMKNSVNKEKMENSGGSFR